MFISTILSSVSCPYFISEQSFDKINGYILLIGCFMSVLLMYIQPEKAWYIGRAVAESIKTLSWRFIMKSEPFEGSNEEETETLFINRCADITRAAMEKDQFSPKGNCYHNNFITDKMKSIRSLAFVERKSVYATERIDNQLQWYNSKSLVNKRKGTIFTIILASCQFIAASYLLFFGAKFLDINISVIMIFIATSCVSILELNKFKELSRSYAFTGFELNTIRNRFGTINEENELNAFVEEAEQAISREHTMWLARRGKKI
jgi:hypothetical protein